MEEEKSKVRMTTPPKEILGKSRPLRSNKSKKNNNPILPDVADVE